MMSFLELLLPWIFNICILIIWISTTFILIYLFLNMINPERANSLIILLKNKLIKLNFLIFSRKKRTQIFLRVKLWLKNKFKYFFNLSSRFFSFIKHKIASFISLVKQWVRGGFKDFFRFLFQKIFILIIYLLVNIFAIGLTLKLINNTSHPLIIESIVEDFAIISIFSFVLLLVGFVIKLTEHSIININESINSLENLITKNKQKISQLSLKIIIYIIIIMLSPVLIFSLIYGVVAFIIQDLPLIYLIKIENLQFALNTAFPNLISDSFITHSTIYQNINVPYIKNLCIDTTYISWLNYITVSQHIVQKLVDVFVIGYIASSIIQILTRPNRKGGTND